MAVISTRFDLSARTTVFLAVLTFIVGSALTVSAQGVRVLSSGEAKPLIPTSFKFEGESANTQMRNSSAASFGRKKNVVAGLVDNSGYSTDVASEYEGFFITDIALRVGGMRLAKGSYAFGFAKNGKMKFRSVTGNRVVTAGTSNDAGLKRPRPLMLLVVNGELRFYKGRTYVVVKEA